MTTLPTRPSRLPAATALAVALAAAALLAAAPTARAARPMITDDARVVDPGACQLETWARAYRRDGAEYWALPGCNPTGNLELTLGGAALRPDAGPSGNLLQWQAKTLFRALQADSWGIGLAVGGVFADTGDGSGRVHEPYFYIPASLSLAADRLFVHANLGAQHLRTAPKTVTTGGTDRVLWGLGLEAVVTAQTLLIAETFGQGGGRAQVQFGVRYWLVPNRLQIDATAGQQGGAEGVGRWYSIGLRILTPPFLP